MLKKFNNIVKKLTSSNAVHLPKFYGLSISDYNFLLTVLGKDKKLLFNFFCDFMIYADLHNILLCDYLETKHSSNPNFIRLKAAVLAGQGKVQDSLSLLLGVEENKHDMLYAVEVLMRPEGREEVLSSYLEERMHLFEKDLLLNLHLANNYFIINQTEKANQVVEKIREQINSNDILQRSRKSIIEQKVDLKNAITHNLLHRNTDLDTSLYSEESIVESHWEPYYSWMLSHSNNLKFNWLSRFYEKKIRECLHSDPNIISVVDFGVMCGLHLSRLAKDFPHVNFYGVDRQCGTAQANRAAFTSQNIQFVVSEIESFLENFTIASGKECLLFHGRTATLCYPGKIKKIYQYCREKGIRNILLFENISLSHDYFKFFDFHDLPDESIVYKDGQFIHNYKLFLNSNGFDICAEKKIHSPLINCNDLYSSGSSHIYIHAKNSQ